ncbi:hypothetical protein THAOC_14719, partial [Thalassiosira oceanica]
MPAMLWKGDLVDYDGSHCQAPPEGAQCLSSSQSAAIRDEESDLVCEDFHPQLLYPLKHDVEREQSIQEIERTDWEQDCKLLVDPADHCKGSGHWQLEIAYGPRLQREQAPEGAPVRETANAYQDRGTWVSDNDGQLAVIRHLSGTLHGHGNTIIPKHGRRVQVIMRLARRVLPEHYIEGRTGWPNRQASEYLTKEEEYDRSNEVLSEVLRMDETVSAVGERCVAAMLILQDKLKQRSMETRVRVNSTMNGSTSLSLMTQQTDERLLISRKSGFRELQKSNLASRSPTEEQIQVVKIQYMMGCHARSRAWPRNSPTPS